jgi:hypothetical protein
MDLRVHLKICEACGCLWYRAQAQTCVYCTSCKERFKEFPTPLTRKRRGRPRKIILPTVFAVQASAESIFHERLARLEGPGIPFHRQSAGFSAPLPVIHSNQPDRAAGAVPVALLASETSVFSTRAAFNGGAL